MSAVSPFVTTYTTETPYITEAEFLAAPTALEVTDLIPGGSQAAQDRAITDTILRASSWVDRICEQVLSATVDIERGEYRVDRKGYVNVPLKFKPVLEVQAVRLGPRVSQMVSMTDFSDVDVRRNSVKIPVWNLALPSNSFPSSIALGDRVVVDVTYVNGWANTFLATTAAIGQLQLTVSKGLGIYPGSLLTISDGVSTEQVTVAASYVAGSTTVPLTSALVHDHAVGVSVNNMPSRVKQATILLTTVLIQTRGSDAIILETMETPTRTSTGYGASSDNVNKAMDLLRNLGRVW